jgi:hypothetical protein
MRKLIVSAMFLVMLSGCFIPTDHLIIGGALQAISLMSECVSVPVENGEQEDK